ncbi:MAG: alpha-ketoglutarate-dependent dioxygenase AlkB [Ignavibacteria bacterium]|nr:alpha-ketoglutarate-dependent dioxygenase AlkB [Ignavibacteria bacterium]
MINANSTREANLLPYDGAALYHGVIIEVSAASECLRKLLTEIEWRHDEARMFGRHIITKRKAAWYGDEEYSYTYSNATKRALIWTPLLLELKTAAELATGTTYNSCLLNLYHNGTEGMAWHSDDEKSLGKDTTIASVSLGAERKFCFKHKTSSEIICTVLEHGSLLVMKGATQTHWMHRLPPTKKITEPRVNLTFRTMLPQ